MIFIRKHQTVIAFLAGILVALWLGKILSINDADWQMVSVTHEDDVHVHSDFLVFLDGQEYDLSFPEYMSSAEAIRHAHLHLHDGSDEVMHRHGEAVTLGDFFGSLNFTLTDNCLTTDANIEYCSNGEKELLVFVNGEAIADPVTYINQEEDQIVIYYGELDPALYEPLFRQVTDESCIYSGTCPERGVAPPESCGLTCEL